MSKYFPIVSIYYYIGSTAYFLIEEYENSIADATEAIAKNPEYARGYYRKAAAMRELDKIEEAIKLIKDSPEKVKEDESIKTILKELEAEYAQDNILPKDHPEIIRFNKFVKWLTEGGAKFDKTKMRYYSADYRGVHASKRVKKNEILVMIPKNLIITLEMAKAAPIGAKMEKANLRLLSPKHSFLSSYVLQEFHNPESKWEPYLDMLPKSTKNFPIFFTEEERSWLIGSPFLAQVEEKIKDVARDYKTIVDAVPEFSKYTEEEFGHARMLVSSRIFGITVDGKKTDSMVPLSDMLNHRCPQQTSWEYKEEYKAFIIDVKESIPRGDEIYDSYGQKCNSRFFMNYGFILEGNTDNEVPMKIWLDEMDPLYTAKMKIIEYSNPKTIRIAENLNKRNTSDFFSYLRFAEFEGDPMVLYKFEFQKSNDDKNDEDNFYKSYRGTNFPPLSVDNEIKVLNKTIFMAKDMLGKYKTTYEEDLKIIETQKDLSFNHSNCVLMRAGEKKILLKLIDLCNLGLELIKMPLKQAKEIYGKRKDKEMFQSYIIGIFNNE